MLSKWDSYIRPYETPAKKSVSDDLIRNTMTILTVDSDIPSFISFDIIKMNTARNIDIPQKSQACINWQCFAICVM